MSSDANPLREASMRSPPWPAPQQQQQQPFQRSPSWPTLQQQQLVQVQYSILPPASSFTPLQQQEPHQLASQVIEIQPIAQFNQPKSIQPIPQIDPPQYFNEAELRMINDILIHFKVCILLSNI